MDWARRRLFSQEERVLIRTGDISFLGPRGLNLETNTLQLRRSPAREQWCFSFTLFSHIQPSSLCCKLSWAPAGRSRDAGLSLTLAVPCWQGRVRSLGTSEERRTLGHTEPSQVKLSKHSSRAKEGNDEQHCRGDPAALCPKLLRVVQTAAFWTVICPQGIHFPNSF